MTKLVDYVEEGKDARKPFFALLAFQAVHSPLQAPEVDIDKYKDRYTQGHCVRVADIACAIAGVSGIEGQSLFWFRIGALLHDVGKLVVPSEVLNKPGKLTPDEWTLMRSHPSAGVDMLAGIDFPWDVRPLIESHHERWDGKGYPHGLKETETPLSARILAVADVYDALTSIRSYKAALTHEEAIETMRRDVGTAFDPAVFARGWTGLSPERVADEVAYLRRRYAFDDLAFQDETFFTNSARVDAIAEHFLQRNLSITWTATLRADQACRLGDDLFAKTVRSGLRRVMVGVESGSQEMLDRLQKDMKIDQVRATAAMCTRHGVGAIFNFIVGFPGESEQSMQATLALASGLLGLAAFWFDNAPAAAVGGVLMLANWPYTMIVIAPTNRALGATADENAGPQSRALIRHWGRLHAVRSALGLAGAGAFLVASI